MKILFYKKIFNRNFSIYDRMKIADIPKLLPPGVEMSFSSNPQDIPKNDVIIFDIPFLRDECLKLQKGNQIWCSWMLEPYEVYDWARDFEEKFDINMSYRRDADIPITYYYYDFRYYLRNPPIKKTKGVAMFLGSSVNKSKRREYAEELWKYIPIDSFGWRRNCDIPDRSYHTKQAISKDYRFVIAFENSIGKDFITEKFYDPLLVGSVPLYLGTPDIEDFVPGENCYINAEKYSPKELAEIIHYYSDDKKYADLFEWKTKPFRKKFMDLLEIQREHFIIRLLRKLGYDL